MQPQEKGPSALLSGQPAVLPCPTSDRRAGRQGDATTFFKPPQSPRGSMGRTAKHPPIPSQGARGPLRSQLVSAGDVWHLKPARQQKAQLPELLFLCIGASTGWASGQSGIKELRGASMAANRSGFGRTWSERAQSAPLAASLLPCQTLELDSSKLGSTTQPRPALSPVVVMGLCLRSQTLTSTA